MIRACISIATATAVLLHTLFCCCTHSLCASPACCCACEHGLASMPDGDSQPYWLEGEWAGFQCCHGCSKPLRIGCNHGPRPKNPPRQQRHCSCILAVPNLANGSRVWEAGGKVAPLFPHLIEAPKAPCLKVANRHLIGAYPAPFGATRPHLALGVLLL